MTPVTQVQLKTVVEFNTSRKHKKQDCLNHQSHSSNRSPKRGRHGASLVHLPDGLFGSSLKLSECLSFSLSTFKKELFQNSSPKDLSNIVLELVAQTLLVCKRLGNEATKGVPTFEFEHLNKELADSTQTLEVTLNANTSLTEKMKEMSHVHSKCGLIKQSLDTKIEELTTEQSRLLNEMESIH
ncbi:hypothetical protein VNO80_25300 [Phaseolus coccineus]|uniref:Uncharacterized protein n=1 Tax=Phaseolus coccineus TaxID=3886 RepID=A0AAN9QQ05_PHACN